MASATTSNLPKLSPRAARALDILADGGCFRYGLERNGFTGREQFQWRLMVANGCRVSGIGRAAFRELERNGFTFRRVPSGFTGSAETHHLTSKDR